jgi:hypothetical protein
MYTVFASLLVRWHDLPAYRVYPSVFDTESEYNFDNDSWVD